MNVAADLTCLANNVLLSSTAYNMSYSCSPTHIHYVPIQATAIADSISSRIYILPNSPWMYRNPTAPPLQVGAATNEVVKSTMSCKLAFSDISNVAEDAHIMSEFTSSLVGLGRFCNNWCKVILTKQDIKIINGQTGNIVF